MDRSGKVEMNNFILGINCVHLLPSVLGCCCGVALQSLRVKMFRGAFGGRFSERNPKFKKRIHIFFLFLRDCY